MVLLLGRAEVKAMSFTCEKINNTLYLIQKLHISPPQTNSAFAEKVVNQFLYSIDGQCMLLHQKDIDEIEQVKQEGYGVDRTLCQSLQYIMSIYSARLRETDSILNQAIAAPYQWSNKDTLIVFRAFSNRFAANTQQKTSILSKWVKMYMLHQLELAQKLNEDYTFETNLKLKTKVINKLRKRIRKNLTEAHKVNAYLEEQMLQAIMSTCDPHSDYFTPSLNKQFTESLSASVESYGFLYNQNENDQIEIVSIKPGSPAWKCNKLHNGDVITKIKFKSHAETDITEFDIDEFETLVNNNTSKELTLTVKKKDGSMAEVRLVKAVVQSDENKVNSYILSGPIPIGYMALPSFYTDFSGKTASGCANDVAKELIKLRDDSIQGLILDLRNNGGGSVEEAIHLAGIFIDAAPLFLLQSAHQKPQLIKDMNRGAIYTGPLVILINKNSASASELLAQILKTQNRAIIVGNQSYGKGSGQIVVPLDTSFQEEKENKKYKESDGYLKITVDKLYDLNGSTYQLSGVTPHIQIPDLWSRFQPGEQRYENALPNDVINKTVNVNTTPDEKITWCRTLSNKRTQADTLYKRIVNLANTWHQASNRYTNVLYPPYYYSKLQTMEQTDSLIELALTNSGSSIQITLNKHESAVVKMDDLLKSTTEEEIADLKKDMVLRETYLILKDYNTN